MIFHTNNGKEFTAKVVLEFLWDLNPHILTVTGRPRRPSDQGSVENMIKCVKRTLGTVLAEYWLVGKHKTGQKCWVALHLQSTCNMAGGENDVSAYEAVYGQKMDHDFLCLKEEARRCWTVPEGLKVTNNPEFTKYARKKYIIDDDKNCDVDAKGYFSDGVLPSDKKEEVSEEYFFDHLQDDITEENHGKGEGYNTFNEFDAESNNDFVDPVCNVLAESSVEGPKKSIMMPLLQKQVAKITTSHVPMYLRKSPPETLIDQSTTQNILLTLPNTNLSTTLVASSSKKTVDSQSSESSEEDSEELKISSKKPKLTKTFEASSLKSDLILNCHHHLKILRLKPN
jgi:hypothetical protein